MKTARRNAGRGEIEELLFRFMRAFDEKDWEAMRGCLLETVYCDYSSFRGTPPGNVARERYVDQRKESLSVLITQHNLSNLSLRPAGKGFTADCNYAILRFHPRFEGSKKDFFHSYGQYRFGVTRTPEGWRISSITQKLLMNDGNPKLHGGARS